MNNLPIIKCIDPFDIHNYILNNKNDKKCTWKKNIININADIKNAFIDYEQNFCKNTLEKITSQSIFNKNGNYLRKLYSFQNKCFVNYKKKIMSIGNTVLSECPICQLDSISSFDHYLPQSDFPQFSDNVYNLIPCCSICNSKKGEKFLDKNQQRIFINLYTDLLPKDVQFLFIRTKFLKNKIPILKYELNETVINNSCLKRVLCNTFKHLNLCERFEKRIPSKLEILKSTLHGGKSNVVSANLLKQAIYMEKLYGINYWEAVFYRECANNLLLLSYLIL